MDTSVGSQQEARPRSARKLVILSGVSGSGKSTALSAFEDLGYFCVDNLPGPIIHHYVDFLLQLPADWQAHFATTEGAERDFALLVDCRDTQSVTEVVRALDRLRGANVCVSLIYFDCRDDVVLRRFQETRRPHPLLVRSERGPSIGDALAREREVLAPFRDVASFVIDTSSYSPHELRARVQQFLGEQKPLEVTFSSFGFKYGPPKDADLIVDVRFLPNPHFVVGLREKTGLESEVRDYVLNSSDAQEFIDRYQQLLTFLLPRYAKEGKRYLNVAIGCTGGRHRSVAIAEEFAKRIRGAEFTLSVRHRDKDRLN